MEKELIQQQELLEFQPKMSICFISKGWVVNVKYAAITHVSKYGNETTVYRASGSYRTYNSLQEILSDLPVNDFFRIHRSHIVSLKYMNGIQKKGIRVLENYLPVSKYYSIQVIARLSELLDRQLIFFNFNPENKIIHESSL